MTKEETAASTGSTEAETVVLVRGLTRPFTLQALKDLLGEYGKLEDFWTNKIKSHCYAFFSCSEEANKCLMGLNGKQWPEVVGKLLETRLLSIELARKAIDSEQSRPSFSHTLSSLSTAAHGTKPAFSSRSGLFARASRDMSALATSSHTNTLISTPIAAMDTDNTNISTPVVDDVVDINKLFRKTKTKPHIYYLPCV